MEYLALIAEPLLSQQDSASDSTSKAPGRSQVSMQSISCAWAWVQMNADECLLMMLQSVDEIHAVLLDADISASQSFFCVTVVQPCCKLFASDEWRLL